MPTTLDDARARTQDDADVPARPRSLRRNFSWTLAGSVTLTGCQWAMTVVIAKLGSPVMLGQFALALALVMPVMLFLNLQLRYVQSTDAKREHPFSDYLGLRLATSALMLFVVAGIVACVGYRRETALIVMALALTRAIESVSDVIYGLLQQQERMDRIAQAQMLQGALQLAALTVLLALSRSILIAILGMAAAAALTLCLVNLRSAARVNQEGRRQASRERAGAGLRPRWDAGALRALAWLGLPMGAIAAMGSLLGNLPRYFLADSRGEHALGIFAAIAYLTIAGSTVVAALGDAVIPRLAKLFAAGNLRAFHALLLKLMSVSLLMGVGGYLVALVAGRPLLTLLYTAEYAEHARAFAWLMAGCILNYITSAFGFAVTAMRRFHNQVAYRIAVLIATYLFCAYYIPREGLLGAGKALCASGAVGALTGLVMFLAALSVARRTSER